MMSFRELFNASPETCIYMIVFLPMMSMIGVCAINAYGQWSSVLIPFLFLLTFIAGWVVHMTYSRERGW